MIVASLMSLTSLAAVELSVEIDRVQAEIAGMTAASCADVMTGYFDDLAALQPDQVDLADVRRNGAATVAAIFDARVQTQTILTDLFDAGQLRPECVAAVRRADSGVALPRGPPARGPSPRGAPGAVAVGRRRLRPRRAAER